MIVNIANFKSSNFPRPSDEVDPLYKETPEYGFDWSSYIYGQYIAGKAFVTPDEQESIQTNRDYAAGRQDTEIYRDMLEQRQDGPRFIGDKEYDSLLNHNETMMSVDFSRIFSPIPKILLNIQGVIEKTEHEIKVAAIDEKSTSLKSQLKWESYVEGQNKPMFDWVRSTLGLPGQDDKSLPQSVEEMELMEKIGSFKLAYEIGIKDALTATANISKNKKVKRRVIRDLFENGKAATFCYEDVGGVIKYKYIDFSELIMEPADDEDYSLSNWGGIVENWTIADLRCRLDVPEKKLAELARAQTKKMAGINWSTERKDGTYYYDDVKIPVLVSYWKSVDSDYVTNHTDGRSYNEPWKYSKSKDGKTAKIYPPRMYNTEHRVTSVHKRRVLYSTKWIIGSDIVFDNGKVTDIPFDFHAKDVRLPFVIYRIPGIPLVELMIPIADQIQLTYLELQNARAKAAPSGLKIELSSIENLKVGKKTLHPLDVIKIRTQTGHMLYRLAPPQMGNPIGIQNPIEELLGGYEPAIISAVKALEMFYQELERVTGIADLSTGKSPTNDQGLGVSQIALETTNNTLSPIYTGWVTMKENMGMYCAIKIHSKISGATGIDSPYFEMLGPAKYNAIKGAGKYPPVYWGIDIQAKIDTLTKQKVLESAQAALSVGKDGIPILTYSEYLFIVDKLQEGANVADIRAFIAYKEQKANELGAQRAQASQAQLQQGQAANDKAKSDAQIQLETTLSSLRIKEKEAEAIIQAKLLALEYALKERLQTNQIRTQADVDNGQLPSGQPNTNGPVNTEGQPPAMPGGMPPGANAPVSGPIVPPSPQASRPMAQPVQ